ncbi:hypothetical protein [Amycolatopsis sp. Hca4]|uniref:hypothetical protein n=1 Tax=Amycolatopsis sp. Hca4 TaxID=2742131 RepID=UPI0015922E0D|nr:hypothetical protein [Amycolatopsis sp. Hca4]QKV74090.1 hypothetical protein HUT10_10150 [Amycolatopsis sp. Hca4]
MTAVRFSCGATSVEELRELEKDLIALDGTQVRESGVPAGAALADVIVVAIITTGTPVVVEAIKSFGKWLRSRRSRGSRESDKPVRVLVEGLRGSCTITITAEIDQAELDLAPLGMITNVREAG